jgi:hypothetical protein
MRRPVKAGLFFMVSVLLDVLPMPFLSHLSRLLPQLL